MTDWSLHILDLVQNALVAKASKINIEFVEDSLGKRTISIEDNGVGMDEETAVHALSPFYTTRSTRKVGLGISFFAQSCEQSGGVVRITSKKGIGTKITGTYQGNHIDALEIGNMGETISLLIAGSTQETIRYHHKTMRGEFTVSSEEIKESLGDISPTNHEVLSWMREYINEHIEQIEGGTYEIVERFEENAR